MTNYKKIILEIDNKDELRLLLECVWNTIKNLKESPYPYAKKTVRKLEETEKKLSKIYLELLNS